MYLVKPICLTWSCFNELQLYDNPLNVQKGQKHPTSCQMIWYSAHGPFSYHVSMCCDVLSQSLVFFAVGGSPVGQKSGCDCGLRVLQWGWCNYSWLINESATLWPKTCPFPLTASVDMERVLARESGTRDCSLITVYFVSSDDTTFRFLGDKTLLVLLYFFVFSLLTALSAVRCLLFCGMYFKALYFFILYSLRLHWNTWVNY